MFEAIPIVNHHTKDEITTQGPCVLLQQRIDLVVVFGLDCLR
jgi:hypothetical protein